MLQQLEQVQWFPYTKFYPPLVGGDVLERPELLRRLYRAVTSARLTLLSAPPGFGKTTLLAALAQAYPELKLAWISLDEEDNEPVSFLSLVLSTLQQVYPGCGAQTQAILAGMANPEAELRRLVGLLINELAELRPAPFVLVLDDLHLVSEPAILDALDYLLERLPPAMHIAAATRHDPALALPRLRARGQLAEFRMDDLRFNEQEVGAWLNGRLQLALAGDNLTLLQQRMEGWVAGVRLLALSLGRIDDSAARSAFIDGLGQSERYVFDFLVDEVLSQQEPELRRFLLETSILAELTPQVCRAVTGRADAAELLEEVYRRNLFLTTNERAAVEAPEASYRYHALFAQALRRQLERERPEQVKALFWRAGQAQTVPAQAVPYYLAAELWDEAAQSIEVVGRQRLEQGLLGRLRRWIKALPAAVREARPWLLLFLGTEAVTRGRYEAARPQIEQALRGFELAGDTGGEAEALVQLGEIFTCLADVDRARPVLERSLGRPLSLRKRIKSEINLVWTTFYQNDWPALERQLMATFNEVLASDDKGAFQSLVLSLGPQYIYGAQGVEPVEQFCRRALARFGEGTGPVQAGAQSYLGYIQAVQGKLAEARQTAERARHICRQLGGFAHVELYSDHVFLIEALARADYQDFQQYWDEILPRVERVMTYRQWLGCYFYLAGRALWLQDRLDELGRLQARLEQTEIAFELPDAQVGRALLAGLAALSERRYEAAEASLGRAVNLQQQIRHSLLMSHAQIGLTYLYWAWERPQEALVALQPALADLERRGLPGVVLQEGVRIMPLLRLAVEQKVRPDFARQVLGLFTSLPEAPALPARPVEIAGSQETLSAREVEVLGLLAAGLTNPEIAAKLYITPGTVKRHTINIYGKLGVNNRTQAVTRGRELGLLA